MHLACPPGTDTAIPGRRVTDVMRRLLLCVCVSVLACLTAPPPPALAAEKAIWGPLDQPDGRSAFPLYRALGVDTFQVSFSWAQVAPHRPADPRDPGDPAYRWPASLDRTVAEARAHGVRVALLVSRSPPWANGGRPDQWVPNASAFADFLTAASRRYPSVRRWMIWGEPNHVDKFRPNRRGSPVGPRAYARILDAAYGALKRESPRNIVIGGMTYTTGTVMPPDWLRFMRLPSGRPARLDWFGHNPFPFRFPDLSEPALSGGYRDISDLDLFAKEVARAYTRPCGKKGARRRCGPRPKLWLSEFLVQSDHPSSIFGLSVTRAAQARWLRAAYDIADRLPSVAGLGWLTLLDQTDAPRSAHWGLLTASGERKPSFFAYKRAQSRAFRPDVSAPRTLSGARIARGGSTIVVRPRATGPVVMELRSARGRLVSRTTRRVEAGTRARMPLVDTARLRPGRYTILVDAPRGERVRRVLTVR